MAGAVRAHAAVEGRDYGLPDDVKALMVPVLCHRLVLGPAAEIEGRTAEVELLDPEEGVSPGQACVFYETEGTRIFGGGWIWKG